MNKVTISAWAIGHQGKPISISGFTTINIWWNRECEEERYGGDAAKITCYQLGMVGEVYP